MANKGWEEFAQAYEAGATVVVSPNIADRVREYLGAPPERVRVSTHMPDDQVLAVMPEQAKLLDGLSPADEHAVVTPPGRVVAKPNLGDAVSCSECGGLAQRTGACYTCTTCGSTTGCG